MRQSVPLYLAPPAKGLELLSINFNVAHLLYLWFRAPSRPHGSSPGHDDEHAARHVDGDHVVGELPLEHQVHRQAAVLTWNMNDRLSK